jgi:hypothetical protein
MKAQDEEWNISAADLQTITLTDGLLNLVLADT